MWLLIKQCDRFLKLKIWPPLWQFHPMLVSWELIPQYLPVVCAGQLVPHVSKFTFNFFFTIMLHWLDFLFQTKSSKTKCNPKERKASVVSEKSTIFMTADEKHKWQLYKGVWRVWWERDVKQSTTIKMKLIRQQLREQRHFATPPCTAKRSVRNDCRNSILMTRRCTTNQKNYIDGGSDTSSV